jgi:hypothetical protein
MSAARSSDLERCSGTVSIIVTWVSRARGSSFPEPSVALYCPTSALRLQAQPAWKPYNAERRKRCALNIVNTNYKEKSAGHSPISKRSLHHLIGACHPAAGPFPLTIQAQMASPLCATNARVVSTWRDGSRAQCSPDSLEASTLHHWSPVNADKHYTKPFNGTASLGSLSRPSVQPIRDDERTAYCSLTHSSPVPRSSSFPSST